MDHRYKYINIKHKTTKLLEDNIGKILDDLEVGGDHFRYNNKGMTHERTFC